MEWTKKKVIQKMEELRDKGFICVPADMFRRDYGIVGQILEREFGVAENNLHLADLGTYELKGMRKKKNKASILTLFHQISTSGLTPNQIFDRFSYEKPSQRDGYHLSENSLPPYMRKRSIASVLFCVGTVMRMSICFFKMSI